MHHHFRQLKSKLNRQKSKDSKIPLLELVADINGVIGGFALYPQVIKVLITNNIEGISLLSFFIILINSSIWLHYALTKRITALRISSTLNVAAASAIILFVAFF